MLRADDPALLTPDQRFRELARLLARGLRRLNSQPGGLSSCRQPTTENLENVRGIALRSRPT
jgi:hypothetical protein